GRDAVAAGVGAGVCWEGSSGPAGGEPGAGAAFAGRDQRELFGREGAAAVSSCDDDGAALARLLQRHLLVAADRQSVSGADRLHDDRGDEDQLVLGTVEASHPSIVFAPDAEIFKRWIRLTSARSATSAGAIWPG